MVDEVAYLKDDVGFLPLRRLDTVVGWARVDAGDFNAVSAHQWSSHSSGFVARRVTTKGHRETIYLHRTVLGLDAGAEPQVRFKNGNRRDCRRSNLRPSNAWAARIFSDASFGWPLARLAISHEAVHGCPPAAPATSVLVGGAMS